MKLRSDYELAVVAILDSLLSRQDIDHNRIAVVEFLSGVCLRCELRRLILESEQSCRFQVGIRQPVDLLAWKI